MNFTRRQLALLTTALALFYDEVSKTSTLEFKTEVLEIAEMVQEDFENKLIEENNQNDTIC